MERYNFLVLEDKIIEFDSVYFNPEFIRLKKITPNPLRLEFDNLPIHLINFIDKEARGCFFIVDKNKNCRKKDLLKELGFYNIYFLKNNKIVESIKFSNEKIYNLYLFKNLKNVQGFLRAKDQLKDYIENCKTISEDYSEVSLDERQVRRLARLCYKEDNTKELKELKIIKINY